MALSPNYLFDPTMQFFCIKAPDGRVTNCGELPLDELLEHEIDALGDHVMTVIPISRYVH